MGYVYDVCQSLARGFAQLLFDYQVVNPERLDVPQPVLVASNHVSFLDPPLVGITYRPPLHFLARKTLYSNPFARWLFPKLNVVPVDQERAEVAPLKTVLRMLKEGKPCIVFPEGARSEDGLLQPGEPGAGFIVAKSGGVPVLPMRIFGAWECLPIGSAKLKFRRVTVVVGELIHFSPEELARGKDTYQNISNKIMAEIAKLECPRDRLPKPR